MPDPSPALPPRQSRFWLFAPFVLLAVAMAGWTTAWLLIRDQTSRVLNAWLADESARGRQWACPGRSVGGFPFRIEVSCASISLQRPGSRLMLGPVTAVAQVYSPRHIIAHAAGPLRASDGQLGVQGTWRLLEASIRTTPEGLQRASFAADGPAFRLTGMTPGDLNLSAQRLEAHVRPHPTRSAEGAYDWSLRAAKLALPGLDVLVGGGTEPTDLDIDLTVTQGRDLAARPLAEELERWRLAGGRVEIARLALAKGPGRIEGKGQFSLDDAHRPQGRAELAAIGLEGFLGTALGGSAGATAALLGALGGRSASRGPAQAGDGKSTNPFLRPLPPLRIEGGRIHLGPLPVPGMRVAPLY
jgi:hypothetical protein